MVPGRSWKGGREEQASVIKNVNYSTLLTMRPETSNVGSADEGFCQFVVEVFLEVVEVRSLYYWSHRYARMGGDQKLIRRSSYYC